jgi:diguanylate cyclase (GGDEF)-like protein
MVYLDMLKQINDSLGHQAGDRLLSDLGEYLRSRTRKTDTVIRYGGEEFLLICPQCAPADAQLLANHLLDGWRDQRPLTTFSIGWAIHGEGAVAQRTIELADMALYDAKRNGRDCARPQVAANSNDVAV